ncbi:DUF1538 family protein [Kocuria arenosa]|uniref:DUF1538 family protein n=1 Tax=Kocuria arenosa TaxID=3071446 RepID=UPI0034D62379
MAVAEQAELASEGRIRALTLRLVVAVSVGSVLVLGTLRILRGWAVQSLLLPGYALVLVATYVARPEIVGLAYDSGGVTTNIVTVPHIAAIGTGLANSLQGRSALSVGITLGVYRIPVGAPLYYVIMAAYAVVMVLVLLAPQYIVALAFDLGASPPRRSPCPS